MQSHVTRRAFYIPRFPTWSDTYLLSREETSHESSLTKQLLAASATATLCVPITGLCGVDEGLSGGELTLDELLELI